MAREGCTPDEAFNRLRVESQATHRKLRAVAADLVEQTIKEADAAPDTT